MDPCFHPKNSHAPWKRWHVIFLGKIPDFNSMQKRLLQNSLRWQLRNRKKWRKLSGSESVISMMFLVSAMPLWNIARNTGLPTARTYLCAGMILGSARVTGVRKGKLNVTHKRFVPRVLISFHSSYSFCLPSFFCLWWSHPLIAKRILWVKRAVKQSNDTEVLSAG